MCISVSMCALVCECECNSTIQFSSVCFVMTVLCHSVKRLDMPAWDHIPTGVTLLDWEGREVIYEGCQYWVPHYCVT